MKTSMNKLRAWIAAGSIAAFMGGWILFAQSGAPAAAAPAVTTVAGTVASQAPGLLTRAKATSTPSPSSAVVTTTTVKPRLRTGGSR